MLNCLCKWILWQYSSTLALNTLFLPEQLCRWMRYDRLSVEDCPMKSVNWSYFLTVLQEHYPVDALFLVLSEYIQADVPNGRWLRANQAAGKLWKRPTAAAFVSEWISLAAFKNFHFCVTGELIVKRSYEVCLDDGADSMWHPLCKIRSVRTVRWNNTWVISTSSENLVFSPSLPRLSSG